MAVKDLNADWENFSRKYLKDIVRDKQVSKIVRVAEIHKSNLVYCFYFET